MERRVGRESESVSEEREKRLTLMCSWNLMVKKVKGAMPQLERRRVLISHSRPLSPLVDKPLESWRMASATPDLRLPSQPRGITALWPVPNYTAWWQRHMCVNNLPKVVTRQCPGAASNLHPWVTSGLQVRHVTVRLPSHTSGHYFR